MRNESKIAQIFVVGIILGAALLYFPPYAWAWVGDDYVQFEYVLPFLKRPLSAIQLFNPYFLPWYYRPTQNLWFLGNRALFGLTPAAFYWQMVLWHSLATALVYRVLRQFGAGLLAAVLATALFAIHGHYVGVIGWNSSVAIVMAAVFSLASLSFYLSFLTVEAPLSVSPRGGEKLVPLPSGGVRGGKNRYLRLSFLFFVLALLTHEEAILLPLFLVVLTFVAGRRQKTKVSRSQIALLGLMAGVTAVYIFIQFNRPNLTIDISGTPTTQWLELVSPTQISQFIKAISLRYTLTMNLDMVQQAAPFMLALVIVLLLGAWFWVGNWTVRLGLIWVLLHSGLIYATLWQSKPNLLAGRHFYQASVGLALVFGGSIDQLLALPSPQIKAGRWRVSVVAAVLVGVITAVLIGHVATIQTNQKKWLRRAETDHSAQEQMQAILPKIEPETRIFANRFAIAPQFFRSIAAVWYELPAPIASPSGSFAQLQLHGKATKDTYVFDYEDGKVYNLMPELQLVDETIFIWSHDPRLDIVAGNGETLKIATEKGEHAYAVTHGDNRRFTVKLAPIGFVDGWLSLAYTIPAVPTDSSLHLGIRTDAEPGALVRVRLEPATGESITLFVGTATNNWLDLTEPMGGFSGQTILVRLETAVAPGGTVYWANPRFVVGD